MNETFKQTMQQLINFFAEFKYEPSIRFVDTLARKLRVPNEPTRVNTVAATNYVKRYFELTNSPYLTGIEDKIKSIEFQSILTAIARLNINKEINKRLEIYYGPQGTGKTTDALTQTANRIVCCHSGMMPEDLLEDFDFEDVHGNPVYKPSALQHAMTDGTPICLDEINLLPFETIRFLQTITDNKTSIIYKDKTINISNGFRIIGTMNLKVGNQIFPLPEPLVDRALDIRRYKITAELLTTLLS